jgi:hypothetical protein
MRTRLILPLLLVAGLGFTACGDGPDPSPTATPTLDPAGFGPTPALQNHIVDVYPPHGASVTQASTRTTNPQDPQGACAEIDYLGTPLLVLMAVNGQDVTTQTVLITDDPVNPTGSRICFDPPEGLPVGRVQAAVSVQEQNAIGQPPKQVVGWIFEVTE